MGINGRCNRGWKPVQKGEREPLCCESCEQYFNEYFEKPFHSQWVAAKLLPNLWHNDDVYWATVDYSSFKLFHLSVLFRASVTSLPTFAEVSLGPHEEKLRQLTLKRDAAEPHQYPVHGVVVVHPETHGIVPVVCPGLHGQAMMDIAAMARSTVGFNGGCACHLTETSSSNAWRFNRMVACRSMQDL